MLKADGGGSVVNVASIDGLQPAANRVIYAMTKSALIAMTQGMAKEYSDDAKGQGVRVNALLPGPVDTKLAAALKEAPGIDQYLDMTMAIKRFAQPDEMVGAVSVHGVRRGEFLHGTMHRRGRRSDIVMAGENAAIAVRKGEELDIAAVDAVLKANVDGLSGDPAVKQYPSGNSNLTYAIDYPDRRLVLRRPPFGPLPKAGHNMFREYRIMRDLKPAFDQVPNTVFYTDDEDVIGKEFYVMDRVDGPLIHNHYSG